MSDKIDGLREIVRSVIEAIDRAQPGVSAEIAIEPLIRAGITAGCGRVHFADGKKHADGSYEALHWFAGEIVDVVQSRSWFAVNSLINCVDRFAAVNP